MRRIVVAVAVAVAVAIVVAVAAKPSAAARPAATSDGARLRRQLPELQLPLFGYRLDGGDMV